MLRARHTTMFVFFVAALSPPAHAEDLIVRTYNTYNVAPGMLETAARVVGSVLAAAGITETWRSCRITARPDAAADACDDRVAPNEVIVRIVSGPAVADATMALGYAYVDVDHHSGTLATVFADRVAALAATLTVDAGTLLGRAMVHEIGHLLLGNQLHAAAGLMRGVWSRDALLADVADDWRFSPGQAADLKAAAEARRPRVVLKR